VDVVVLDALQTRLVLCEGHVCLLLVRLAEVDLLIWGDDIEGDVFGRVLLWIISLDYRQVPEGVQDRALIAGLDPVSRLVDLLWGMVERGQQPPTEFFVLA
jgi:hypothetical protein